MRWTRILFARGWATPAWTPEWGGTGWSAVKQYIFKEELHMAPAPEPLSFNVNMIGPVLIAFGTEAQKRHFLPRIARLDDWFCQGFSEPGAGSDLASLRTQARLEGDHYIVNGQKLWTSTAHHADWCFLLVRTDPNAKKQSGITYLLMDMKSPGITVRPIITIDGYHETNEMFLENVRIPVANRIGEENKGWDYAKYLLGHERSGIARVGVSKMRVRRAKELAARVPAGEGMLGEDTGFRERVAALEVELKALEMTQMRVIAESAAATRQGRSEGLHSQAQGFRASASRHRAAPGSRRLCSDGIRSPVPERRGDERERRRLGRDHRAQSLLDPACLDRRRLE